MALNYTNIIKQAKARERKIVRLRKLGWSFQAIGIEFMISRQRAQQIYKKALICNVEVS